jgi:CBS domain containing-hemolysin-like protein
VKALFIILTGLLVLVNAFFVIAEYSLVRSRRARLQAMADEGKRGARLALTQLEHIGDYIAACQVGITMASIGIGPSASLPWPTCSNPCWAARWVTPRRSQCRWCSPTC